MASGTINLGPTIGNGSGGGGGGTTLIPVSGQTFVANTSSSAGYTFNAANTEFVGGVIRQVAQPDPTNLINGANVLISGDNVTKNGGTNGAFDAGAVSSQQIAAGDGFTQFQMLVGNNMVAGLTHSFPTFAYTNIDFGFNPAGGQLYIVEDNAVYGPVSTFTPSDVLKVSIESGVVLYRKNGTTVYTSLQAPIYPLFFAAAITAIGDGASNILIEPPAEYSGDVIVFPTFNYSGVGTLQAFSSSTISDINTPHYTLNNLYWNGSAWVASDSSYAQSNPKGTINSFIPLLPAQNALTVRMITETSFSQMSLSALTITYIGQTNTPPGTSILEFASNASAGGSSSEALTVTGLLSTDTILAVSQKTPGANSEPLLGFSVQVNNGLTAVWPSDPGAGAVILVAVKR